MKALLFFILLFNKSLLSQTSNINNTYGSQSEYYNSYLIDYENKYVNNFNNSSGVDYIIINGENEGSRFGYPVSLAGDVNGDGYSDVLVSDRKYNSFTGRAYLFYGGKSIDTIPDIIMTGESINSYFGRSISTAGDVNGDGYSDLVICSYDNFNFRKGKAFIYFGGSVMDNIPDVVIADDTTAMSVSIAGDVNNDGFSDVIVGATNGRSHIGRVYIFFGGSLMNNIADVIITGDTINNQFGEYVSTAGDLNNDGYSDVLVGATGEHSGAYIYYGGINMDNSVDVKLASTNMHIASNAGDVNGDGYDDIIMGITYDIGNKHVSIFYGGSTMDNIADVVITGETINNLFGSCVKSAGDINKDGFSDIMVSAPQLNINCDCNGKVLFYFGGGKYGYNSRYSFKRK